MADLKTVAKFKLHRQTLIIVHGIRSKLIGIKLGTNHIPKIRKSISSLC